MKYEIEYIERIAKIISENNLTEIILEDGEQAITVRKDSPCNVVSENIVQPQMQSVPVENVQKPLAAESVKQDTPSLGTPITSPMVGAFYAAPAPGAKPFVKVGDVVSTGQVVCIVEAMKLMNEIETEVSGKITQICVEDGQSVEYGQVLMYVK